MANIHYQQWNGAADFARGSFHGTRVHDGRLVIDHPTGRRDYTDPSGDGGTVTYDVATWTSPTVSPGFGLTEVVASWNAVTPPGTWIQVDVSGEADDGAATKEYVLGRWASTVEAMHRTSVPVQGDELASVDVDTLITRPGRHWRSWELTVSLYRRQGSAATPAVALLGAMASHLPGRGSPVTVSASGDAAGSVLDVPPYSQELHIGEHPQYNGGGEAWCSPTSTAMVMSYFGQLPDAAEYAWADGCRNPWVDHAAAHTYDWSYEGTGNWPFNTAYAAGFGLEAFVTRLRSLREAEQFIRAGIPLVASVSFTEEELDGAGYGTGGHLLVIVGFSDGGDVVVNDPASGLVASNDEVRRIYDRAQFENVWLPHSGGIVYVIRPRDVPLPPAPAEPNW